MLRQSLFLVALALAVPVPAQAAIELAGARFAREATAGGERLALRGAALFEWRSLIKAYAAALYLPPDAPSSAALADVPKRLEISYFRAIDADSFGRAADALLRRTLAPEQEAPLRERLDELHARYEPVAPGDRYALTYQPGVGTELAKNGRPLALVPGADLAAAYFALWLGPDPVDVQLRDRLLGDAKTRAPN